MATGQPIVIVFTQWHTVTLILCSYSLLRKALSMGYNVKKILFCKSIINLAFETVIYLNLSKIFNRSAAFENLYLWMSESLIVSRITMNHWEKVIFQSEKMILTIGPPFPITCPKQIQNMTETEWSSQRKKKSLEKKNIYSTFRANPAKTGGLIFVSLISFPKLYFFIFIFIKRYLLPWTYFAIKKNNSWNQSAWRHQYGVL